MNFEDKSMTSNGAIIILYFTALDPNLPGYYEYYNSFDDTESLETYHDMCGKFEKINTCQYPILRDNTYNVSCFFIGHKNSIVYRRPFIIKSENIDLGVLETIRDYENTAEFVRDLLECQKN